MKVVIRALALTIVATGIAAGAYSKGIAPANQVVSAAAPVPTCPIVGPGAGGCGVW